MQSLFATLLARGAEPSSWGGIGVLLSTAGYAMPDGLGKYVVWTLSGICGIAAFFVREKPAAIPAK